MFSEIFSENKELTEKLKTALHEARNLTEDALIIEEDELATIAFHSEDEYKTTEEREKAFREQLVDVRLAQRIRDLINEAMDLLDEIE